MCFGAFRLHAAPTERDRLGIWGYKHIAPPEQEPQNTDHFSRKAGLTVLRSLVRLSRTVPFFIANLAYQFGDFRAIKFFERQ